MSIEEKYSIQTKIYAMDFTRGDDKDYQALQTLLTPIEVTVLGKDVVSGLAAAMSVVFI